MTESASLLPVARFGCEKLVLVGDPKQLDPTIQGSEPGHDASLEQTLFDRLLLMVRYQGFVCIYYRAFNFCIKRTNCYTFYKNDKILK